MGQVSRIPIGDRIRFHRDARRKTQAVVAGLAGITEDYLSQIERGLKVPTIGLLSRIAEVLHVSPAVLLDPTAPGEREPARHIPAVQQAMFAPWLQQPSSEAPDLEGLASWVALAWSQWQTSIRRYSTTAGLLPQLIVDAETAVRAYSAPGCSEARRRANEIASDLYFLLRTYCKRAGRVDLSLVAADRGLRAAEASGDEVRVAAAHWNLGHALLGDGEFEQALAVALAAANRLEVFLATHAGQEAASMLGALHLLAADADARYGDSVTQRMDLQRRAGEAADLCGEGNVYWTVFGPMNVRMHAVTIELEAGRPATAIDLAKSIDPSLSVSMERRLTFTLDLARCWERRGDDAAVLHHLLSAERHAPEDLRLHPDAHELIRVLIRRTGRSLAPDVRSLAERTQVLHAEPC